MTFDPIGLRGGINFYVYVWNNPINYIDPLGLKKICKQLTEWKELPSISDSNKPPPGAELVNSTIKDYYKTIEVRMFEFGAPGFGQTGALACACLQKWLYRNIESVYLVDILYEALFLCWCEGGSDFWAEPQQKTEKEFKKYVEKISLWGSWWQPGFAIGNTCSCYTSLGVIEQ